MNRQRFVVLSMLAVLAGTSSRRVSASVLSTAAARSGLACRISYADGSVSELALQPMDRDCLRHYSVNFTTRHSRTIRLMEVGKFEPVFRRLEFSEPVRLDRKFRPGESIAVAYFSGAKWLSPWLVAHIERTPEHAELIVASGSASHMRMPTQYGEEASYEAFL